MPSINRLSNMFEPTYEPSHIHQHVYNDPLTSYLPMDPFSLYNQRTPRRYFSLGCISCTIAGFVFVIGLVLMVWGSSPHEPDAIWITGIVFLFLGGFLFFLGINSIGIYLSREDRRKRELERARTRHYAASISSARSIRSSDIYLIE